MPLAELRVTNSVQHELPLQDLRQQPAGSVTVSIELRDVAQPKAISLQAAGTDADGAAVQIQSSARGHTSRSATAGDGAVPLVLRLQRLVLTEEVQRQEGVTSVVIEVDFFGLVSDLKTPAIKPKASGTNVDFEHAIQITAKCPEADVLRRVVQSRDDQDSDIFLTVVASTRSGSKSLGVAFINLKEQSRLGSGKSVTLPVRGPDERSVGTLEVSLDATAAVHRAVGADTLRVDVMELLSYDALRQDTSVTELFVEVDMAGLKDATHLKTKALKKNAAALDFGYSHSVSVTPGSRAQQELQKALKTGDEQDSDIYFSLKTRDGRGQEKELGQGHVSLLKMSRDGRNLVSEQVTLLAPKGGSVGTLTVSVLAAETLQAALGTAPAPTSTSLPRAAGAPAPPSLDDQLSIRVESLSLAAAYQRDPRQQRFYVTIDFLGGKEFSSPEVAKAATAAPLQINKQFTFPVDSAHPAARDQLLRAMQPGAAATQAEIKFRLYHAVTAEEGDELASGSLSLRKLWDEPRRQELTSHRLELFDPMKRESSHAVVSTSVLPALRRLLEPAPVRAGMPPSRHA